MSNNVMNQINNAICCMIMAATFAMIGIEASIHSIPTHSGTQEIHK